MPPGLQAGGHGDSADSNSQGGGTHGLSVTQVQHPATSEVNKPRKRGEIVMKKSIFVLIAVALAAPVAAFAADRVNVAGKAQSAVEPISCGAQSDSIQERIAKLQKEQSKGNAVYSKEQLNNINSELEEYRLLQASLLNN
jgi:hypothetical protein